MTQLFVTVGVGGVGKTTVSASLAVALARQKKKTLVITIDPSRRLAQDLDLDPTTAEPRQVGERLLWGVVLDIPSTFERLIRRFSPKKEVAEQILNSVIYQSMVKTLFGTQEYMAVEALHDYIHSGEWDCIVLDTPPSKHVMDFFTAPQKLARFFGGASARWFVRMAKSTRLVVKAFKMFWGSHFLEEIIQFFTRMEGFFDGFSQRSEEMLQVFRSDKCRLLFVTSPERLDLNESKKLREELKAFDLGFQYTILNRVLPKCEGSTSLERLEQAGLDHDMIEEWKTTYGYFEQKSKEQWARLADSPELIPLTAVEYEISSLRGLELLSQQLDNTPLCRDS